MKHNKRKLALQGETLRNLSTGELGGIRGGMSSAKATLCSTWEDGGCQPSGNDVCMSIQCPTGVQETCTSTC
jgi:hypothetical protein